MPRRTHAPPGTPTKSLANFRRFSYAPGRCAPIRDLSAKTFSPRASRPSGGGNYAAADHFRGRHRFQQLRTGSQGRHPAGARNRAQHPSRARRGNAAHDRRAPGPGADQRAARSATSTDSAASPHGFLDQYGEGGVVLVADREGRQLFSSVTPTPQSLPPRNNRAIVDKVFANKKPVLLQTCSSARSRSG